MLKLKAFLAGAILLCLSAGVSAQTNLNATLTTDDAFQFYISTSDSVAGTLVGTGDYWPVIHTFSAALTPGVTNYIHIAGQDVYGVIAAFLGSFTLSDASFAFANGTQSLSTDTINWKVNQTGFGDPSVAPISYGANGVGPWGFQGAIDPSAQWIWTPSGCTFCGVYATAEIFSVTSPIPEPETYAMLLAGLGLLGFAARRKKLKLAAAA